MAIVLLASAAFTTVAYDIPYLVSTPFWWDELWVAVSVRYPIGDLPTLTSSTPIAWNAAQQALSVFGEHAQRILPLLFSTLAAAAAYFLGYLATTGRMRTRVLTGAFVASAVALSPLMLRRTDLKQYTADVFVTLLVIAIMILVDRSGSLGTLIALTVVSSLGLFLTLTIPFTAATAFVTLAITSLVRRRRAQFLPLLVGAIISGVSIAITYFALYARSSSALKAWWGVRGYFPQLGDLVHYVVTQLGVDAGTQSPIRTRILAVLVLATFALVGWMAWRSRRFAPALFLVGLSAGMCLAGVLGVYPLLDLRTSLFLLMSFMAIGSLAAAHAIIAIAGRVRAGAPRVLFAAVAGATGIAILATVGWPALRSHSVYFDNNVHAAEDARSQIDYVRSHWHNGDTIIVDDRGAMALEYYWPELRGQWTTATDLPNGFAMRFPKAPAIIVVPLLTRVAAMDAIVSTERTGRPQSTVWFIPTHSRTHFRIGRTTISELPGIERINVGVEPLFRLSGIPAV